MTVIKLGRSTYRVYSTTPIAMSFLFYIKNGVPVMKCYDVADDYFKYPEVAFDYTKMATEAMENYIAGTAKMWEDQGYLMGTQI